MGEFDLHFAGPPDVVVEVLQGCLRVSGATVTARDFSVPLGETGGRFAFHLRARGHIEQEPDGVRLVGVIDDAPLSRATTGLAAAVVIGGCTWRAVVDGSVFPAVAGLLGAALLVAFHRAGRARAVRIGHARWRVITDEAEALVRLHTGGHPLLAPSSPPATA
jgi:hypothetical protein